MDGGRLLSLSWWPSLSPVTVAALFWLRPPQLPGSPWWITPGWRGGECAWRLTSAVKPHLQWIIEAPVVVSRPRQEGGRDGCARCRGDVQKGVAGGAGGRATEGGRGDTGEVDAERETSLFQSFLRHGEGLQLLLPVGHVGVLAATTDTVQARLRETA